MSNGFTKENDGNHIWTRLNIPLMFDMSGIKFFKSNMTILIFFKIAERSSEREAMSKVILGNTTSNDSWSVSNDIEKKGTNIFIMPRASFKCSSRDAMSSWKARSSFLILASKSSIGFIIPSISHAKSPVKDPRMASRMAFNASCNSFKNDSNSSNARNTFPHSALTDGEPRFSMISWMSFTVCMATFLTFVSGIPCFVSFINASQSFRLILPSWSVSITSNACFIWISDRLVSIFTNESFFINPESSNETFEERSSRRNSALSFLVSAGCVRNKKVANAKAIRPTKQTTSSSPEKSPADFLPGHGTQRVPWRVYSALQLAQRTPLSSYPVAHLPTVLFPPEQAFGNGQR